MSDDDTNRDDTNPGDAQLTILSPEERTELRESLTSGLEVKPSPFMEPPPVAPAESIHPVVEAMLSGELVTAPLVPDAVLAPEESPPVLFLSPPPPPEFGATHELVFSDGTVEPLRLVEGGFVDRDGRFLLRGECDRHGTLRRVLPR